MSAKDRARTSPDFAFWLFLIALWALSFVTQHDWTFSTDAAEKTAEDLAAAAAEGDLLRRVALPLSAVLGVVAFYFHAPGRLTKPSFTGWILISLFLWMAASVMWSDQPQLSVRRVIAFACLMMSALGTAAIALDRFPTFALVFALGNLVVGIVAELSLGSFMAGAEGYRFGGTMHPNLQGANLVVLILACAWLVFSSQSGKRTLAVLSLGGIAFTFLLLTQSRTSVATLAVVLVLSLTLIGVRKWGVGVLIPLASVVGAALGPLLLLYAFSWSSGFGVLASQVVTTDRDLGDPTQLTGRVDLWYEVLGFVAQRPWLGWGFDAFWSPQRVLQISWALQWQINQAHNSYLEMVANLGIVGVALYILAIGSALIVSARSYVSGSEADGFLSAVTFFAVAHGLLESITVLPTFPTYIMFVALFIQGYFRHFIVEGKLDDS